MYWIGGGSGEEDTREGSEFAGAWVWLDLSRSWNLTLVPALPCSLQLNELHFRVRMVCQLFPAIRIRMQSIWARHGGVRRHISRRMCCEVGWLMVNVQGFVC